MAFIEGSQLGLTSDATPVTIVSAPSAGVRRIVRNVTVCNLDDDTAVTTLQINDNGTVYQLARTFLSIGETLSYTDVVILDTANKSLEVVLAYPVTSLQLPFTSHYADAS